jgi:hypothetical protein
LSDITNLSHLISQGRYLEARHLAEQLQSGNADVRRLYGLALSKSGMPEEALDQLLPLHEAHSDDPETAGILGSVYKELFKKHRSTTFALQARDTYLKNFLSTRNYYTGVNAASMSAMIMQGAKSREIATQVIDLIDKDTTDFWELATLGEAYFIVKEKEKSLDHYASARKAAGNDWGKTGSVYNQLWLLDHYLPVNRQLLKLFQPPGIVAFIGHMIDHPGRPTARFPASIEKQIKDAIVSNLVAIDAHIGFCSLACGSDMLFAEAMAGLGRELNIYLPFNIPDFIDASLRFAGETWVQRFHALIDVHSVRIITEESYSGYDALFDFQSKIIFGSAILRSLPQQNRATLLTVLSETDWKKKVGGTSYSLKLWPFADRHLNINPDVFLSGERVTNPSAVLPSPVESLPHRKIWNHIAVDVTGLTPVFIEKIHKDVVRLNTDALPFRSTEISKDLTVYSFESEFGAFDLMIHLQSLVGTFPKHQQPGIHLHSGLTTETEGKLSGEGIETVIELSRLNIPGIRASEHVAAMLALQPNKYNLEFAGIVVLKNEKKLSIYRVGRSTTA